MKIKKHIRTNTIRCFCRCGSTSKIWWQKNEKKKWLSWVVFLTCSFWIIERNLSQKSVKKSNCANLDNTVRNTVTELVPKYYIKLVWWLFILAVFSVSVSHSNKACSFVIAMVSTNNTSIGYLSRTLNGNALNSGFIHLSFYCRLWKELLHSDMETGPVLWFSFLFFPFSILNLGSFRLDFLPLALCLSWFVFQNNTYIRFQLFVFPYRAFIWLYHTAGILIDTP